MITLEEKERESLIRYSFKKGRHAGEVYSARYEMCPDPTCTCTGITLHFDMKNDQSLSPELEVHLDLIEKSIAKGTRKVTNRRFAKRLIRDFDIGDWRSLAKLFQDQKTLYAEESDLMSLDVSFPLDEIELSGLLISYFEVLPFASYMPFDVDGTTLIVEDLYCVLPFCNCGNVHLFFKPYHEDRLLLPFHTEKSEDTYIVYNIKKNKWHTKEESGIPVNPRRLMASFRNAYDIQSIYSKRYATIRSVYKNYRKEYIGPTLASDAANIGRNDPCPCGSGKKYKHCCMLKDY